MDIKSWLVDYFKEKSSKESFSLDDNFFEQGLIDSFDVIVLIDDVEVNFSITLNEHHFQDRRFSTISGLAEIIHEEVQS